MSDDLMHASKYDSFVSALRALCIKHSVQLSSSGYDGLQVWDLPEGEDPIYLSVIDNCTKS